MNTPAARPLLDPALLDTLQALLLVVLYKFLKLVIRKLRAFFAGGVSAPEGA